jgi:hypothetical protein
MCTSLLFMCMSLLLGVHGVCEWVFFCRGGDLAIFCRIVLCGRTDPYLSIVVDKYTSVIATEKSYFLS